MPALFSICGWFYMKIGSYNNFHTQFKGKNCRPNLYHHLKKDLYSGNSLFRISDALNDEDRNIGCLPKEWIDKIDSDEIGEKTEQIHKTFANFAKFVYSFQTDERKKEINEILEAFRYRYFMEGHTEEETIKATKETKELIAQKSKEVVYNAMKNMEASIGEILGSECEINYLNRGSFGIVFKITIGGKSCALKVFKPKPNDLCLLSAHGQMPEIASAIHLNKNIKPSQCSKFYLGRFSSNKQNDAYMLTSYVERPKKAISNQRGVWKSSDCSISKYAINDNNFDNVIHGKLVDFGGVSYRFKNEEQRKIAKELLPLIQNNDTEGIEILRQKYGNSKDFLTVLNSFF